MPQLAPVVLKDGAEVDRTFAPRDISGGVATLVRSTGVPIGDERLVVQHTRTPTGREKVSFKLVLPQVQDVVVSGVSKPTVVRTAFFDAVFTFDQTSSETDRDHAIGYAWSLLGNLGMTRKLVVDLEHLY